MNSKVLVDLKIIETPSCAASGYARKCVIFYLNYQVEFFSIEMVLSLSITEAFHLKTFRSFAINLFNISCRLCKFVEKEIKEVLFFISQVIIIPPENLAG